MKDDRQVAYEAHRKAWRDEWWIADTEDFCARKEVDPRTGKWLVESVSRETPKTLAQKAENVRDT